MSKQGRRKCGKRILTVAGLVSSCYIICNRITRKGNTPSETNEKKPNMDNKGKKESAGKKSSLLKLTYENNIKKALDKGLSFLGLFCLLPLYLLIAFAIFLDDPGPVLFTQKRIGKDRHFFKLHKFRTMKMDTPHDVPTHQLEHPEEYITGVGKLLRRTSLDELPQLWDIFCGEMSIVGPRPALWNQDDLVAERDKYGANNALPGLTGWAQINGRDELEISDKARLDGEYVKHLRQGGFKALFFDMKCIAGTVLNVVGGEGVVEGGTGSLEKDDLTAAKNRIEKCGTSTAEDGIKKCRTSVSETGFDECAYKKKFVIDTKSVLILVNHDISIYNFRLELVEALLAEGYEVHISSPTGEHTQDLMTLGAHFHETKIDRHGMNPKDELQILKEYRRLINAIHPIAVLSYTVKPNIYGGIAARAAHVPFIANITGLGTIVNGGGIKALIVLLLYRLGLSRAQKVFFQNQDNRNFMLKKHLVFRPCEVLPGSGVNLEIHSFEPYPEETGCLIFTTIGRIMHDKGTDELLRAAEKIRKKYSFVTFRLIGFFDDDYKMKISDAVRKGIVEYIGQQRDIHPWIKDSHAIIHPSYHEGMSNVLLEAAATGRPVLASNIPGCRETFEEAVSGFGFKSQDIDSLVETIERFILLPYRQKEAMGKAGREKIEREFSRDIVVGKYMQEIKNAQKV